MRKSKVFCIGFQKTGTSTLAAALKRLGYRVTGPDFLYGKMAIPTIQRGLGKKLAEYDAFQDSPWPILYRYLAKTDPNAKFILTVRDSESWLNSVVDHFGGTWTPLRQATYGVGDPKLCPELYLKKYERHNASVIEFFSKDPERLLVLQTSELSDWDRLCNFLGEDLPAEAVPTANTRQQRLDFKTSFRGRLSATKHKLRLWLNR